MNWPVQQKQVVEQGEGQNCRKTWNTSNVAPKGTYFSTTSTELDKCSGGLKKIKVLWMLLLCVTLRPWRDKKSWILLPVFPCSINRSSSSLRLAYYNYILSLFRNEDIYGSLFRFTHNECPVLSWHRLRGKIIYHQF